MHKKDILLAHLPIMGQACPHSVHDAVNRYNAGKIQVNANHAVIQNTRQISNNARVNVMIVSLKFSQVCPIQT